MWLRITQTTNGFNDLRPNRERNIESQRPPFAIKAPFREDVLLFQLSDRFFLGIPNRPHESHLVLLARIGRNLDLCIEARARVLRLRCDRHFGAAKCGMDRPP